MERKKWSWQKVRTGQSVSQSPKIGLTERERGGFLLPPPSFAVPEKGRTMGDKTRAAELINREKENKKGTSVVSS